MIDEADRLFDMGFLPDIKRVLRGMGPRGARQNLLSSATLNRVSRTIAAEDPTSRSLSSSHRNN